MAAQVEAELAAVDQDLADLVEQLRRARLRRRWLTRAIVLLVSAIGVGLLARALVGGRKDSQDHSAQTGHSSSGQEPAGDLPEPIPKKKIKAKDVKQGDPPEPVEPATERPAAPGGISGEILGAIAGSVITLVGAMGVAAHQRQRDDRVDEACVEIARSLSTGPKLFAELLSVIDDERVLNRALARLSAINRVTVNQGVSWEWRND